MTKSNIISQFQNPFRWIILSLFILLAGLSQFLWLNFAPILSQIQSRYGVSELMASLLIMIFAILYIFLSIPTGIVIDKRGYKFGIGLGAIIMSLFSFVRVFDQSFWMLLIGQTGIAIAQPFILNGISKLVADWFDEKEAGLATGLGTVGMFAGMAVSLGLTPVLMSTIGLHNTMVASALITIFVSMLFLIFSKENQQNQSSTRQSINFFEILKNKNVILLAIVSLLAQGLFNGIATWLEMILKPFGVSSEQAGIVGGLLILGGILGAGIIPMISDKFRNRKLFLGACLVTSLFFIYPLCTNGNFKLLILMGFLFGFLFLPGYALLLTMGEETCGPKMAGSVTSLLMLTGNVGGVGITIAMQAVKGAHPTWTNAVILIIVLQIISIGVSFFVKDYIKTR